MFTVSFWKDTAERVVKTFAQALVAVLAVGTPIFDIDWGQGLGVAATAAVASLLTSIASIGAADKGTASLVSVSSPQS